MAVAPSGSRVRIVARTHSGEVTHEGILLAPASPGHVTIKLTNGYNVSYPDDSVSSCEILSEAGSESEQSYFTPEQDSSLPEVWILHTGGTIASKVDYVTGAVAARFEPEELLDAVPELASHARIRTRKLGNMWSDDIRTQHWNLMMEAAADAFDAGAAGVVITHGTDTMHFSAAAASYAWAGAGGRPPGKIVFTGSQRSSDRGSTDGTENLLAAVHWAARGPEPSGEEGDTSVIIMHAGSDDGMCVVLPGCSVRKFHSSRRDTFAAINRNPIATIRVERGGACEITLSDSYSESYNTVRTISKLPIKFSPDIRILQLLAGSHMFADQIELATNGGYDAILLHGSGLGHLPIEDPNGDAPENTELLEAMRSYCAGGGIAVMVTQCIHGPVHMDVYSKGRDQQALGIIGNHACCSPDSALIKLHYLLSVAREKELTGPQIRDCVGDGWASDLCGENPASIPN